MSFAVNTLKGSIVSMLIIFKCLVDLLLLLLAFYYIGNYFSMKNVFNKSDFCSQCIFPIEEIDGKKLNFQGGGQFKVVSAIKMEMIRGSTSVDIFLLKKPNISVFNV